MGRKKTTKAQAAELLGSEGVPPTEDAPPSAVVATDVAKTTAGAKVTISASHVYTIGDVSFGVDPESIVTTVRNVENLPSTDQEKIVTLHGETTDGIDSERILVLAKSFVQNDWYTHYKGDIPMKTAKNHAARVAKKGATAAKKNGANGKARAPRGQAIRFSKAVKDVEKTFGDKSKAALIAGIFAKGMPMTCRALCDAVVKKTGDPKDDKITQWFVWKGKKEGQIVGA